MPGPPPIPQSTAPPPKAGRARLMALLSLSLGLAGVLLPLSGVATFRAMDLRTAALIQASVTLALSIAGVACGVAGVCGIRRHVRKGILGFGLSGLFLNLLMLALFFAGFFRGSQEATANRRVRVANESTRQMIQDLKNSVSNGTPGERLKVDEIAREMTDASQNLSGDNQTMVRASAAYLAQITAATRIYDEGLDALEKAEVLYPENIVSKATLQNRRMAVEKFLAAAEHYKKFQVDAEKIFRAELVRQKASPTAMETAMRDFQASVRGKNHLVVQIREADIRMGQAMLGLIDLQESRWGKWKYNKAEETIDFESDDDVEKYAKFLRVIEEIGVEQRQLQQQVLGSK